MPLARRSPTFHASSTLLTKQYHQSLHQAPRLVSSPRSTSPHHARPRTTPCLPSSPHVVFPPNHVSPPIHSPRPQLCLNLAALYYLPLCRTYTHTAPPLPLHLCFRGDRSADHLRLRLSPRSRDICRLPLAVHLALAPLPLPWKRVAEGTTNLPHES